MFERMRTVGDRRDGMTRDASSSGICGASSDRFLRVGICAVVLSGAALAFGGCGSEAAPTASDAPSTTTGSEASPTTTAPLLADRPPLTSYELAQVGSLGPINWALYSARDEDHVCAALATTEDCESVGQSSPPFGDEITDPYSGISGCVADPSEPLTVLGSQFTAEGSIVYGTVDARVESVQLPDHEADLKASVSNGSFVVIGELPDQEISLVLTTADGLSARCLSAEGARLSGVFCEELR